MPLSARLVCDKPPVVSNTQAQAFLAVKQPTTAKKRRLRAAALAGSFGTCEPARRPLTLALRQSVADGRGDLVGSGAHTRAYVTAGPVRANMKPGDARDFGNVISTERIASSPREKSLRTLLGPSAAAA